MATGGRTGAGRLRGRPWILILCVWWLGIAGGESTGGVGVAAASLPESRVASRQRGQARPEGSPQRTCCACGSPKVAFGAHEDGRWCRFLCKLCSRGPGRGGGEALLRLNARCEACTKRASFGAAGSLKAVRCGQHRRQGGDTDVRSKRCEHGGCPRQAVFGLAEVKGRMFCSQHRGSVHLNKGVHKCRNVEGCRRHASFGVLGTSPVACSLHRSGGDVNLRHAAVGAGGDAGGECGRRGGGKGDPKGR